MTAIKTGVDDPGTEVAEGDALVMLLQDREHQRPMRSVARDGHQPEQRADCQQRAVRGNACKAIRRAKRGLDEPFPHKTHNKAQEVHHSHDFRGRSV